MVSFIDWQVEKEAKMRDWQNPSQVKYYCKYHLVFVPKWGNIVQRRSWYFSLIDTIWLCVWSRIRIIR